MERTCSVCDDPLPLGSSHQRLYCGQRCKEKARWAQVKADPVRQAYARTKNRRAVDTYQAKHPRPVRWLAAQRKLAKAARGKSPIRRWYMGWCAECGEPWVANQPAGVVCSHRCGRRRVRVMQRARHGRMDNHRKRARLLGVEYEPISKRKVFERDGWRCGICGRMVNEKLSAQHQRGATLDHIVPMNSLDMGSHTYANVQCAHRECNTRKGRRGASQLLLIA